MGFESRLFQFMCLLIPILTGQIPRWWNLVASIKFAISKGVEIDVEESANLFLVISFYFRILLKRKELTLIP